MTAASTRFSFILDPCGSPSSRLEDTRILETESFVVVPSLGSLVPGWLLIVPKRRVSNCSMLTNGEQLELKSLIGRLDKALTCFSGSVFAFEHGATHAGSLTGCGVDQAHLHLVPLEFDLLVTASTAQGIHWDTRKQGSIVDLSGSREGEYVAISNLKLGETIIGTPARPTSQWVRKLIAANIGRPGEWDYRAAPRHDLIAMTVRALSSPSGEKA